MKNNLFLLFMAILCCNEIFAQDNWTWSNPVPNGNSNNSVFFINNNVGYIVGAQGKILKTIDTGEIWVNVNSNVNSNLFSVFFTSQDTGYISGENGLVLKTIDEGKNWTKLNSTTNSSLTKIYFVDNKEGYIIGAKGCLLKTIDGGASWNSLYNDTLTNFLDIKFHNKDVGYVLGSNSLVLKTINAGSDWIVKKDGEQNIYTSSLILFDENKLKIGGYEILITTNDGGNHWTSQTTTYSDFCNIFFTNSLVGYKGDGYIISKTINGGNTWEIIYNTNNFDDFLTELYFLDSNTGIALSLNGDILKTNDAGITWENKINCVTRKKLNSVCFTNSNKGFACGDAGVVLQTTDNGLTWLPINNLSIINNCNTLNFPSENTGYIFGDDLSIYKTNNNGQTWQFSYFESGYNENFTKSFFLNNDTGFVVSTYGDFYKTTNGGENWIVTNIENSFFDNSINSIFFINYNKGFVVGKNGIYKTNDAGETWVKSNYTIPSTICYNDVYFFNENIGFVIGTFCTVLKTKDGGNNWTEINISQNPYSMFCYDLNSIKFIDNLVGYIVGSEGEIYKTINGGNSWIEQDSITGQKLNSIAFTNNNTAFVVGNYGTIINNKMNNNSIEHIKSNKKEISFYPCPSTDFINFSIDEKKSKLIIYDITGKVTKLCFDLELLNSKDVRLNISSLEKGIYIVEIKTPNSVYIGKIIKQ